MTPVEVAFLWARAKKLDDLCLLHASKGEEFHPADRFEPVSDEPVMTHAVFQRSPDRLVLRLRHPVDRLVTDERLDLIAGTFYGGRKFTALPSILLRDLPVVERAFYCEDLPTGSL